MERNPNKLTGEELVMALIFSKDRKLFVPQALGRIFYFSLIATAQAGVGLQKGAEKLMPRL